MLAIRLWHWIHRYSLPNLTAMLVGEIEIPHIDLPIIDGVDAMAMCIAIRPGEC